MRTVAHPARCNTRITAEQKARMQPLVKRIRENAKAEADRLRASGWTKQDFANALAEMLAD